MWPDFSSSRWRWQVSWSEGSRLQKKWWSQAMSTPWTLLTEPATASDSIFLVMVCFTWILSNRYLLDTWWLSGNELTCNAGGAGDTGLIPGSGRSPGGVLATHSHILAWDSHRQRSLAGYSSWGCKDFDMTKQLIFARFSNSSKDTSSFTDHFLKQISAGFTHIFNWRMIISLGWRKDLVRPHTAAHTPSWTQPWCWVQAGPLCTSREVRRWRPQPHGACGQCHPVGRAVLRTGVCPHHAAPEGRACFSLVSPVRWDPLVTLLPWGIWQCHGHFWADQIHVLREFYTWNLNLEEIKNEDKI